MSGGGIPVRVVVVGCGAIAKTGHFPALTRSDDVVLVGVSDVDETAAAEAADRHGVPVLSDLAAALSVDATAVIIATPPEVTPRLTAQALDLGLDVLCEKPIAVTIPEAEVLLRKQQDSSQIVQVGFKNRFSPLVTAVRDWIAQGRLGSPVAFTIGGFDETYDPADTAHFARVQNALRYGSAFLHDGAHLADFMTYLTGSSPRRVQAVGVKSDPRYDSENFVSALVDYDNGDVARLEIGWLFPHSPPATFIAFGPDGVAVVDRAGGTATLHTLESTEQIGVDRPLNDICFDIQLAHFASAVRRLAPPSPNLHDGLISLRLGESVQESMRSRRTVVIDETSGSAS